MEKVLEEVYEDGSNSVKKVEVLLITYLEGTEGEQRYSSTLSLTSTLVAGGWLTPHSGRFTP
jgi:hypothetical protein